MKYDQIEKLWLERGVDIRLKIFSGSRIFRNIQEVSEYVGYFRNAELFQEFLKFLGSFMNIFGISGIS
jgi:hypothetical protein